MFYCCNKEATDLPMSLSITSSATHYFMRLPQWQQNLWKIRLIDHKESTNNWLNIHYNIHIQNMRMCFRWHSVYLIHELFCLPQLLLHCVNEPPGLSLNGLGKLVYRDWWNMYWQLQISLQRDRKCPRLFWCRNLISQSICVYFIGGWYLQFPFDIWGNPLPYNFELF